jgi:hypothetical protein
MFSVCEQRKRRERITLEMLLQASVNHDASDDRDRVYALLGLVSDRRGLFEPDYSKSAESLYQQAMISVMEFRKDLDWFVYTVEIWRSGKPTWCVDFSTKAWTWYANKLRWFRREKAEQAGATKGRDNFKLGHDPEHGTIELVGVEVGRISLIKLPKSGTSRVKLRAATNSPLEEQSSVKSDVIEAIMTDIKDLTGFAHDAWTRWRGSEKSDLKIRSADVWKTAAGGMDFRHALVGSFADVDKQINGYDLLGRVMGLMEGNYDLTVLKQHSKAIQIAIYAYLQIAANTEDCCFFARDTNYIGYCYRNIQAGDVLYILFGCKFPAILRPQQDGAYTIVTFAYTDDIMEGEYFSDYDSVEEKSFLLR